MPQNQEEIQLQQILHEFKPPVNPQDILPYVPVNIRQNKRQIIRPPSVLSDVDLMNEYIEKKEKAKRETKTRRDEERRRLAAETKSICKGKVLKSVNKNIAELKKKLKSIAKESKLNFAKSIQVSAETKEQRKVMKSEISKFNKSVQEKLKQKLETVSSVESMKSISKYLTGAGTLYELEFNLDLK